MFKKVLIVSMIVNVFGIMGCSDDKDDDNNNTTGAGPYSFTISGTGFSPHNGQAVRAVLVKASDNSIVGGQQAMTVAGGSFTFTWSDVLQPNVAYKVNYFADLSGNGRCDAPSTDHVWTRDIAPVTQDTTLDVTHDTTWVDVCSTFRFNLNFAGTGYDAHNNTLFSVVVVDDAGTATTADDNVIVQDSITALSGGAFSFFWPALLEHNRTYQIHYFADFLGNGVCDAPPSDHVWTEVIPAVTDHVAVNVTHNTSFSSVANVCTFF